MADQVEGDGTRLVDVPIDIHGFLVSDVDHAMKIDDTIVDHSEMSPKLAVSDAFDAHSFD